MTFRQAALVTGGARRIGRAIVLALADRGYDIALHYGRSEAAARETAAAVRERGRRCECFPCDLADAAAVEELGDRVRTAFPSLSLLVNSAAIFERGPLGETDAAQLDRHWAVNCRAPVLLTRDLARAGMEGQIINLLDTRVTRSRTAYAAYALSKQALAGFTRSAAVDLAPRIRVNGIAPGLILPPPGEDDAYLDRLAERIPLRRKGSAAAVLAGLAYLLDNDFVTGECLFVDGGEQLV